MIKEASCFKQEFLYKKLFFNKKNEGYYLCLFYIDGMKGLFRACIGNLVILWSLNKRIANMEEFGPMKGINFALLISGLI